MNAKRAKEQAEKLHMVRSATAVPNSHCVFALMLNSVWHSLLYLAE